MGCGTGAQSLVLAGQLPGQVMAVDLYPAFLDELAKKVVAAHRQEIDLYKRHQAHYSYGFYIARKDAR